MPLVLIVDDNAVNRKLARTVLQVAGFRTIEAANGADGIALAAVHLPDVILMDLRLPDMHGAEAAMKLRGGDRTARIPVLAMTASQLEASGDWLESAGFAGWLEKPIGVSTLAAEVGRYLGGTSG